jgi:hypothetical protein
MRIKQTGSRLHKEAAKLNEPKVQLSKTDTKSTLAEIISRRGLTLSEHGGMKYWQHLPEGPPVLVEVVSYDIGLELSSTKVSLAPVRLPPNLEPAKPKNESFSPAPYLSDYGEVPSTFCIWTPRKPGTSMADASFPDDYALFMTSEKIKADTLSGCIAIACYHSINTLAQTYKPEECYITLVSADGVHSNPVEYTFFGAKTFPTKYMWMVEPDPKVLSRLQPCCELPPVYDHMQDLVFFEWEFNWSRMPIKSVTFKPDPNLSADFTMLSINNNDKIYKFDRHVRLLDDPNVVALTGAVLSTAETGAGGSSSKAWRRVGDEWLCGGMHHGGVPHQEGYRNRMTPPQVLLQGIKKYTGQAWKPHYSQPFEQKFSPLAAHICKIITDEEEYGVDLGHNVPPNVASLPIFGDLDSVCEGVMAPGQWNHMLKKIYKKVGSHSLARTILYNSTSKRVAEYDPEAAAQARKWFDEDMEQHLDRQYGYGYHDGPWALGDYHSVLSPQGLFQSTTSESPALAGLLGKAASKLLERAGTAITTKLFVNEAPSWDQLAPHKGDARVSRNATPEEKSQAKAAAENNPLKISEDVGVNQAFRFYNHADLLPAVTEPSPVCIGGSVNESFVQEVEVEPLSEEVEYALQKANDSLDGTYPGNPRCYSIPTAQHYVARSTPLYGRSQQVPDPTGPNARRWIASSDSTPFPRKHLPQYQDYEERTDNTTSMPPASEASRKHFEYYLRLFLTHNHGDYMSMPLEEFGQILSMLAGTLDGSLVHTEHFRKLLGNQVVYDKRDENVQDKHPIHKKIANFMGLTPYTTNSRTKPWFYQKEKTSWFDRWADVCWDEEMDRPAGACAAKGPEFVRRSINAQFHKKLSRTTNYSKDHLEEYFKGLPAPAWNGDLTLEEYFRKILKGVSPNKGSAWNKCTGESTKGEWIANRETGQSNLLSVIYRILLVAATEHDLVLRTSPKGLFEAGLLVPEELFAKDEIHLNKKVDSDRLRIIWNAAVSAELVLRFFHDTQNKLEIELYQAGYTHSKEFPNFGSCSGMGHHDEGIKETCQAMRNLLNGEDGSRPHNGVSTDASGWDISVTRALWMADAHRRAYAACEGHFPFGWCYGLLNLGAILSAHVIVIGREMFEVRWFGMLSSGCSSTTSSNTNMRGIVQSEPHWRQTKARGDPKVGKSLCMGDDNHAKDPTSEDMKDVWIQLGVKIDEDGETIPHGKPIPFTSHLYFINEDTAEFNNGPKICLRLAYHGHQKLTKEQATGIRFAVRHTPQLKARIDDFISKANNGKGKEWLDIDLEDPYVAMDFDTVF